MTPIEETQQHLEQLADELTNFEELATYLRPSSGEIPVLKGMEICGLSMPLKGDIGGDHLIYIDFKHRYDLEARIAEAQAEGRLDVVERLNELKRRGGILVADVSGHRITDAFLGAMLHQAFLLGVYYELDRYGEITTRIFEHINTRFYRTTPAHKFFTMIYGEIVEDGRFRFLSAGHPPPAVFSRKFKKLMPISQDRLVSFQPVGMLPTSDDPDEAKQVPGRHYKQRYKVNEISLLSPGDILLLYTDGLSEHDGGRYFPTRLEELLAEAGDASPKEICERIRVDLLERAEPKDDISVVLIRRMV